MGRGLYVNNVRVNEALSQLPETNAAINLTLMCCIYLIRAKC